MKNIEKKKISAKIKNVNVYFNKGANMLLQLDIQDVISKNMSDDRRTKIAQFVSLAVGLFSIVVSIIMAHSDIKSAYE